MIIITILAAILFVLLVLINRKRGLKAFFSLFVNFMMIVLSVYLMSIGVNPILIALVFSIGASAFILFFINGINSKTKIAYFSVVLVLLLISLFIFYIGSEGRLTGFGLRFTDMYYVYRPNISINFIHVAIAVILIGLTGAITDTALDISTSLHEVYQNNPHLSFGELVQSGNNMGSDILGTMVNTLFFVFIGEFVAFLLVYLRYEQSFGVIINDPLFLQEVGQFLIGNLGCILVIPATILIQSYLYTKGMPKGPGKNKNSLKDTGK